MLTLESLSYRFCRDVDKVSILEEFVELERLAGVEGSQPELLQVPQRRRTRLAEVVPLRTG